MTSKQVSVRLSATGGRQVRAELEGVGEAGSRGFGRLSREMEAANKRMAASLDTTVASIQVLERAGDLAGVSMGRNEQATMQLSAGIWPRCCSWVRRLGFQRS